MKHSVALISLILLFALAQLAAPAPAVLTDGSASAASAATAAAAAGAAAYDAAAEVPQEEPHQGGLRGKRSIVAPSRARVPRGCLGRCRQAEPSPSQFVFDPDATRTVPPRRLETAAMVFYSQYLAVGDDDDE